MTKFNSITLITLTAFATFLSLRTTDAFSLGDIALISRERQTGQYIESRPASDDDIAERDATNDVITNDDLRDDPTDDLAGDDTSGDDTTEDDTTEDDTPADDTLEDDNTEDDTSGDDTPITDDEPCVPNTDGFFGSTGNTEDVLVNYYYELVTDTSTDVASTLSSLESSIASMIADGFINDCIRRNLKPTLRKRYLNLEGFISTPEDRSTGAACAEAELGASEKCDVVEGGLTIFVDGDAAPYTNQILTRIENEMDPENGSLQNVDGVKKLIFFVPQATPVVESPSESNPDEDPSRAIGGINITAAALASSLTVGFVLAGFFVGRRYFKKEDEEEEEAEQNLEVDPSDEFEDIPVDSSDDFNESGLVVNGDSIMNSSGSVTVSSSFAN